MLLENSMRNLITHKKALYFLWVYIADYQAGKIEQHEANALIAAMFESVLWEA
jgi:hypothetical protein